MASSRLRRAAALFLTLVFAAGTALAGSAAYPMPIQTARDTEAVYLFNADTGKTILRQNADQQQYIASTFPKTLDELKQVRNLKADVIKGKLGGEIMEALQQARQNPISTELCRQDRKRDA